MKVSGQVKLPRNFPDFLHDSKNKQELYALLASNATSISIEKIICATSGMV